MRARISTLARERRQSMNSYIICALESVLKTDEEADGTYVEPVVEMVAPAQMVAIRPQLMEGSPCRYNGVPKIIEAIQVNDSEDGVNAVINVDGLNIWVPLEDLKWY
jgi:hypothetical protein